MGLLHTALGNELADFAQGKESAEQALADVEAAYVAAAKEKASCRKQSWWRGYPLRNPLTLADEVNETPHFFLVFLADRSAMLLFIAMPIVSVIVQSMFTPHEAVFLTVETWHALQVYGRNHY